MQKIIIKNFGPVKDAEIEIKKVLLLIGEQASGKSTIAKLIYFFKNLNSDLFIYLCQKMAVIDVDIEACFTSFVKEAFQNFFGSILYLPEFEITFYYNFKNNHYLENKKYLKLLLGSSNEFNAEFSENFFLDSDLKNFEELKNFAKNLAKTKEDQKSSWLFESSQNSLFDRLYMGLSLMFNNKQNLSLFVIAGRNATVSYSDLFEKYLFARVQNKLEQNISKSSELKEQGTDEVLMLKFIERVDYIKSIFRKFKNFEGIIHNEKQENVKQFLKKIVNQINTILKGKYRIDNDGEKIILNNQEKVYLHNASSGQQEVIRILQDIFMVFIEKAKVLRIVEEPEAHLFPIAQKQLIELLALMVNYQPENQLIITTHSPYILTVFNHLLFASRVVAKNPAAEAEVNEIVDKDCWLDPNEFSAYSLGNESFPEDNAAYCESIFDTEQGMLEENYLDTVSEMLGYEFNSLYRIHGKTFKR